MMKKIILTLSCAAIMQLGGAEYMKTTAKELKRDNGTVKQTAYSLKYKGGSSFEYTLTVDQSGMPVRKKWGDFNLGMSHGSHLNGGWCHWEVISLIGADGKEPMKMEQPLSVSAVPFAGGIAGDIVWPTVSLRIIQLDSAPKWLFVKVSCKNAMKTLMLRAWPGGTHWDIKGRERHLQNASGDYDLKKTRQEIPMGSGALALFNRNYSEDYGNFLIFNPAEFSKLEAQSNNTVIMSFTPVKAVREFTFAFGYFARESAAEATGRFLAEQSPNISALLKGMNWQPGLDLTAANKEFAAVDKLLRETPSGATYRAEFTALEQEFKRAAAAKDAPGVAAAGEKLSALRKKVAGNALDALL